MRLKTLAAVAAALLLQGCGSSDAPPDADASGGAIAGAAGGAAGVQMASASAAAAASNPPTAKGRAQLWVENCPRCHNARPATFYTLREWDVAMHHMRVRCSLTAEEHKKIMEFFKASK